jgi:hypothetical protein
MMMILFIHLAATASMILALNLVFRNDQGLPFGMLLDPSVPTFRLETSL